jgi:hypothetical protein
MSKRNLDAGMRHAVCMSLTYRTRVSVQPYTPLGVPGEYTVKGTYFSC